MTLVRIRDDQLTYEWDGTVIAGPVSTEENAKGNLGPRWIEVTLYRKEDGTYVVHQVNRSVVWHLASGKGHVLKPEWISRDELDENAVYCGSLPARPGRKQCRPVHGRPGGNENEVLLEADQHRVIYCPDHHTVRKEVAQARRGDGSVSAAVSEPMQRLLDEAADNDPAFASGSTVMRM